MQLSFMSFIATMNVIVFGRCSLCCSQVKKLFCIAKLQSQVGSEISNLELTYFNLKATFVASNGFVFFFFFFEKFY